MQEKSAEQLLREETGSSYKNDGSVRAALVFPNSYYLGMSSLGFQVILDEINQHPDCSCERCFFHRDNPVRMPLSFETQRPLSEFDIIAFSISFELDYFNVVSLLIKAGIPLISEDRKLHHPLIIAGGICPTFNPEPLAEFIDAFVIGDGEEAIHEILSVYQNWRQSGDNRRSLHRDLSDIEGIYVPSLYNVAYEEDGSISGVVAQSGAKHEVKRLYIGEVDEFDTASTILSPNTEFAGFFLVELARGCAHRCNFCIASYSQRCRIRSREAVLRLTQRELAKEAKKIGLVGSSVTDHPHIDDIASSLVDAGNRISVASMRADMVSDDLLDALAVSGQRTITLAPEAASQRLRETIGKDLSLDAIFHAIELALGKGIFNVKLYFMVGLPTETQADLDDIVSVARRTKKLMMEIIKPCGSIVPRLTISISPFVPKPHTPFQWCRMDTTKALSRKLQFLRRSLGKIGGIRVPSSSARWAAVQGVLARGDRRLAGVLCDFANESMSWNQALKKRGLNQDFYLQRVRQLDELFPWDHINLGISRSRLASRFLTASG